MPPRECGSGGDLKARRRGGQQVASGQSARARLRAHRIADVVRSEGDASDVAVTRDTMKSPKRRQAGECGPHDPKRTAQAKASTGRRTRQQGGQNDNNKSNPGLRHGSLPAPVSAHHYMTSRGTESSHWSWIGAAPNGLKPKQLKPPPKTRAVEVASCSRVPGMWSMIAFSGRSRRLSCKAPIIWTSKSKTRDSALLPQHGMPAQHVLAHRIGLDGAKQYPRRFEIIGRQT